MGSGAPPAATLTRARPLAPGRRAGAGVDCNECLCSIATVAISQVLEAGFLTEEELVSDPEEAVANILACSIQLLPELEAAGITILALLVRDSTWARGTRARAALRVTRCEGESRTHPALRPPCPTPSAAHQLRGDLRARDPLRVGEARPLAGPGPGARDGLSRRERARRPPGGPVWSAARRRY